ncbi:MAG TPA: alanine--tRNA ligase [Euryarchaeota archaeon]|nr:alanine--tRNA ligase [Euryarchaeota archaeon]
MFLKNVAKPLLLFSATCFLMAPVNEKKIKAEFKARAKADPERFYPVEVLKAEGFSRGICSRCGTAFWSTVSRDVCGEPECSGGYSFIGNSPAKKKMDFIETWQEFSKLFSRLGYTPIQRYPVAARWRDDTDFVQASIYDFQPYVVSGEIEPPANPLVVPQFCLRFNDIDNVGYTGRHYTGFVMIGQHAFEPPESYSPPDYLSHIYTWLIRGMGLPKDEIQFHEDTWAGGGNMGPSMEFFSRGLEIGNQVYMQYDIRSGTPRELAIKVLDMGMGQERPAWFTHGTATSYEANFGGAIERLYKSTGIRPNHDVVERFLPYSGMLNFDEVDDIERVWKYISDEIGIELARLKSEIEPLAALYSIADHTRSLLVALSDGALPSNVGGGYNLRTLLRRALDIISSNSWDIGLVDVCSWHAEYLKPQYPELAEHLDEVAEILSVEERKHSETRAKSKRVVASLKGGLTLDRLITLYDSQGITPQMLTEANLKVDVPPDFYAKVSERHQKVEARAKTGKGLQLPLEGVGKTEILYYDDYLRLEFEAKVLRIIDNKFVVLDKTAFYPTSGGQLHDIGAISGRKVSDIFKQGSVVVHVVKNPDFKEGDMVACRIDRDRRTQLAQHHTATHIINGVSREILGEHIWQAGAEKTLEKARLDITHYAALSFAQLAEIEGRANEIIKEGLPVVSKILKRDVAESLYGFRLYQGGAVPGKELRIVRIEGVDVEACGGTHLHNTSEAKIIKIMGSTKIQDGIVRLEFTAGSAAEKFIEKEIFGRLTATMDIIIDSEVLDEGAKAILVSRRDEIKTSSNSILSQKEFQSNLDYINALDLELSRCSQLFSVSPENLPKTLKKFLAEITKNRAEMKTYKIPLPSHAQFKPGDMLYETCLHIFNDLWKGERKLLETAKKEATDNQAQEFEVLSAGGFEIIVSRVEGSAKDILKLAKKLSGTNRIVVLFGVGDRVSVVATRGDAAVDMGGLTRELAELLGGRGGGRPDFGQGSGVDTAKVAQAMEYALSAIKSAVSEK